MIWPYLLAALWTSCLCGTASAMRTSLQTRQAEESNTTAAGSGGTTGSGGLCPPLMRELLASRAKQNTIMFAVINEAQFDFARNWLHWVKKVGIDYYFVAATDANTSRRLIDMDEPCFDRVDEKVTALGLQWGHEGWRHMTWAKVFVLDAIVDWGFNVVVSDVDVVWFKDPLPLFDIHQDAGKRIRATCCSARMARAAIMILAIADWRRAAAHITTSTLECAYKLMRTPIVQPHPTAERLKGAFNNSVWMGIIPPSIASNAHSYFLQRLHKVKQVEPYMVHMTWTYNGIPGKRSRLRDAGLWMVDSPEYYNDGSFVTVDLNHPEAPLDYNSWNENEDMVSYHLDSIHKQLQQVYVGMALAAVAKRAFILPQFQCYCEKIWYSVVRCRVVDAQTMPLPVPCPQDYLFDPGHYVDFPDAHGPPLNVREASFLQHEAVPDEIKDSVLTIRPSAELGCTDCTKEEAAEGGGKTVLVPPGLKDGQLLLLLGDKYASYRVWRLSFTGVGTTRRAFGGFSNATHAIQFDKRMEHITTSFCCRRKEETGRYHKEKEMAVMLQMYKEFNFSSLHAAPPRL
ncbi:hypothetical protein CHLNCDRAFT_59017 [Chlorella variabilis]|uniref:Glycosyltransferase n=1 Tax=Chlorella variabilis TaxID=554065 RepID=E1ZQ43_CHLVA|nr:hypothetical protein CHLNCDRAFT_59017 [Chlorella variabilis]EFN52091.1 hypothetical protein CHLNCDRAFT_59017 [Chlorella variabilis]|eukprot:XP_005844193.1 hypothetical protein CHLNCDRAFT_59017 [Chlorella variabilis]